MADLLVDEVLCAHIRRSLRWRLHLEDGLVLLVEELGWSHHLVIGLVPCVRVRSIPHVSLGFRGVQIRIIRLSLALLGWQGVIARALVVIVGFIDSVLSGTDFTDLLPNILEISILNNGLKAALVRLFRSKTRVEILLADWRLQVWQSQWGLISVVLAEELLSMPLNFMWLNRRCI